MKDKKFDDLLGELKKEVYIKDIDNKEDFIEKNIVLNEEKNVNYKKNDFHIDSNFNKHLPDKFNTAWSENKETLIFFLLISAVVILIGLLASNSYIIYTGCGSFLLFSLIIFIVFFKYAQKANKDFKVPPELVERMNIIERKIDFISKKERNYLSSSRLNELEEQIQEIKTVLKTLIDTNKR